jgi:two-component SAPR family response regulator
MKELNKEMGLPEDKRPQTKLIGEDGNIFNLMGIASRSLKDAGYKQEATEMIERITTTAKSYDEALNIITQYVNPVGDDIEIVDTEMQLRGY